TRNPSAANFRNSSHLCPDCFFCAGPEPNRLRREQFEAAISLIFGVDSELIRMTRDDRRHAHTNGALMQSENQKGFVSKKRQWAGRFISALPVLFLLVDALMKLAKADVVIKTTVGLGYAETVVVPLGIVLLACMVLYLIPQTAVLGGILLTGYLGG